MYKHSQTSVSNILYYSFSLSIGPECAGIPFRQPPQPSGPEAAPLADTSGPVRDSQSRLTASERLSAELKIYKKIER